MKGKDIKVSSRPQRQAVLLSTGLFTAGPATQAAITHTAASTVPTWRSRNSVRLRSHSARRDPAAAPQPEPARPQGLDPLPLRSHTGAQEEEGQAVQPHVSDAYAVHCQPLEAPALPQNQVDGQQAQGQDGQQAVGAGGPGAAR